MQASDAPPGDHWTAAPSPRALRATTDLALIVMLVTMMTSGCGAASDDPVSPGARSGATSSGREAETHARAGSDAGLSAAAASDAGQTAPHATAPPRPASGAGGAPLPGRLEAFTLAWAVGLARSDPGAVCDAFRHPNRFEYESASRTLTWDWCGGSFTTTLLQGSRVLDEEEALTVTSAYSRIALAAPSCGIDDPVVFLDVRSTTGSAQYVVASMACYPVFENLTYVEDARVFELLDVLQDISSSP